MMSLGHNELTIKKIYIISLKFIPESMIIFPTSDNIIDKSQREIARSLRSQKVNISPEP